MISASMLLRSVDRLPYPQRMRLLAEHARRMAGTPELGTLVAELGKADSFARDIAVFLAGAAQDAAVLHPFLTDADGAIRTRAFRAWLLSGGAQHVEMAQLLDDAPYEIRQVVYAQLRRKRRRLRAPGLADAIVDAVRARFGDEEARRLLPSCTPQTAARLLPELGAGRTWNATVAAHPALALTEARRQLSSLPEAQRTPWWGSFGAGILGTAGTDPHQVLDLLAEFAPSTILPGAPCTHIRLAKAYPRRFLELMLDPRRAEWLRRARLSRSLLQALASLPDDQIIRLAVRLPVRGHPGGGRGPGSRLGRGGAMARVEQRGAGRGRTGCAAMDRPARRRAAAPAGTHR